MPGTESTRTNAIGMVNIDGSGKITVAVQEDKTYLHAPRMDPDLDMVLYLTSERPDSSIQGWLKAYQGGLLQGCSAYLAQRPSRVGRGARYVGVHYWRDEGGIVLFDFTLIPCQRRELFTPEEMDRLSVRQATGFHTAEKILLVGDRSYIYDLATGDLQTVSLPGVEVCRLSPSDRLVACFAQADSYRGVWLRVFRLADGVLEHERYLAAQYDPGFGWDVSWSPSGDALVYHRCVRPDTQGPYYSCEFQGAENLGIYVWDLETDEERLVTTGGIMPYWIDWGSTSTERPTP
ncbi:MAG: hypothetical protein GXO36_00750 [Chloroflexi bacterium]|nr:hypothetical protein [Chloroflexota bacterium]